MRVLPPKSFNVLEISMHWCLDCVSLAASHSSTSRIQLLSRLSGSENVGLRDPTVSAWPATEDPKVGVKTVPTTGRF